MIKNFLKKHYFPVILLAIVILRAFVLFPVQVQGTSMYPTLKSGERGISFLVGTNSFNRGDIVVVDVDGRYLVKRVVGLPGEKISAQNGKVYINGERIEEPYISSNVFTSDFNSEVAADEVFCLGDNRENSVDSRRYGPFKFDAIKAKGFLPLLPFSSGN